MNYSHVGADEHSSILSWSSSLADEGAIASGSSLIGTSVSTGPTDVPTATANVPLGATMTQTG